MTYNIIATGSSGNAVLINDNILVDIGVPFSKLAPHAGKIKLVLLTHAHGDHFKPSTVRKLHQLHPAIRFGCCEWMVGPLLEAGVRVNAIDVFLPGYCHGYVLDKFAGVDGAPEEASIQAIETPHNVRNCCYLIEFPKARETAFYATDTSSLAAVEAKNYTIYFVEANHRRAEIEARIAAKQAAGEFAYELEAMRNHLSEEQAMDWLAANMGPNSRYCLLHQHTEKEKYSNGEV